jgi:Flp pilus assembly protein TadG
MNRRRSRSRGQALAEFALVIPIFLALLFGMFDLGKVIWASNSLANAAREGARFAIVHGGSKANPCPAGPAAPETVIPPVSASCPHPSPSREAIRDVARSFAFAGGDNIRVEVCYGAGCSGNTDITGATNARGTQVTVTIHSTVGLVTGTLIGRSSYSLSASSTMLINH